MSARLYSGFGVEGSRAAKRVPSKAFPRHLGLCTSGVMHKLSRRLVDENQIVVVEDLTVKGLVKTPTLAKAISDAGWGTLTRFLEYKCERDGKAFIRTNRWFPSSTACSACGHVRDRMGLEVRRWTCSHCGACHDRDVNAAKTIRDEGLRMVASGTGASASRGTISRRKKLASRSARPDEAGSPRL
jgi:putative transposase